MGMCSFYHQLREGKSLLDLQKCICLFFFFSKDEELSDNLQYGSLMPASQMSFAKFSRIHTSYKQSFLPLEPISHE